jgi:hypothetical protein
MQVFDFVGSNTKHIWRGWSDGSVDYTSVQAAGDCQMGVYWGPCGVLDGACRADVTRDATVNVNDFLEVIGHWGPCE